MVKMMDRINPSYYKNGDVECIDAIRSALGHDGFIGFLQGQVMKYVWRYQQKNGLEDLHKAKWYLTRLEAEMMEDE